MGAGTLSAAENDTSSLKIGLIADPQYCDHPDAGSRFYRKSLDKLQEAVDAFKQAKVDCVVTVGDLIDRDFVSFQAVNQRYDKLDKIPHFPVLGNHDWSVEEQDKPKVIEAMGVSSPYYSKVYGSWRLVFLDSTDVATFRPETKEVALQQLAALKTSGAHNGYPWNSALGPEQLKWLNAELATASQAKQQVILFNHCPVLPPKDGHNLWNDEALRKIITAHPCVKAYLNGHNHAGNYATENGCHFLNLKGMVETSDTNAYAIATCASGKIDIKGFGREPSRQLKLRSNHS